MSSPPPAASARAQLLSVATSSRWRAPFPPLSDYASAREAAVLILFGVLDDIPATTAEAAVPRDLDVLLQRRASTLSAHPGQVSFPGGGRDASDADQAATALREAEEETGLDPAGVDVLATLPEVPIAPSNYRVTPVLGWWRTPSRVAAVDHAETVEVYRVPVAHLLDPATRVTAVHRHPRGSFRGPAFDLGGTIVWGFTAMVLDGIFDAAGWTEPWDADRERIV